LTVHGIKAQKNRGTIIRLYLNLPEGQAPPPVTDPHYAGSITLLRHVHCEMGQDATLPITDALRDLRKAGLCKDGDALTVTLVPRRPSEKKGSTAEIPFDKVTLDVAR
jgi:hypothetical protein